LCYQLSLLCVDDSLRHSHTPSVGCNQNVDGRTDKGVTI
jgi:hypothetical protein